MKVEQLYYTRVDGEGWKFVGTSEGITQQNKEEFLRIHGDMSGSKNVYSLDVYGRNYYLSKITASGADSLGRGISFIHAYVFSNADKEYVFENYKRLLALDEFATSANSMKVIDDLPLNQFDYGFIKERLNIADFIECVYEAILSRKPLYIYTEEQNEEIFIRAIMSVIYKYLPLSLRSYLSFASAENGITRDIIISHMLGKKYGIIYNLQTGEVQGTNGEYRDFVQLIMNSPESLEKVHDYIKNANYTDELNVDICQKAMNFVLMQYQGDDISPESIAGELFELLDAEKYYDQASVSYIAMLIGTVVSKEVGISSIVHTMILDAYTKTNFQELKDAIASYTAYTYKKGCTVEDFSAFQRIKEQDITLYTQVTNEAIKGRATEFIQFFAKAAVESDIHSRFITESCDELCADIIAGEMAKYILTQENKVNLIADMTERSLHKNVINHIVAYELSDEMIWSYLKQAFSHKGSYDVFCELEEKARNSFLYKFIVDSEEKIDDVCQIIRNVHGVDRGCVRIYTQMLAENERYSAVDHIYAEIMIYDEHTRNDIMKLYNELHNISRVTTCFDKIALYRYMSIAKEDCIDLEKTKRVIDEARMFLVSLGAEVNEKIEELKQYYWEEHFNISYWEITTSADFAPLFTELNEKSRSVEALSHAVSALKYGEYIGHEDLQAVVELLTGVNSSLQLFERKRIIKQLKEEFVKEDIYDHGGNRARAQKRSGRKAKKNANKFSENHMNSYSYDYGRPQMNMELYLLMHYVCSDMNEGLSSSMKVPSTMELTEYIRNCTEDNNYGEDWHLLNKENVVVDLYAMMHEQDENAIIKALDDFIDTLEKPVKKSVKKQIRKLTRVPDYTWVGVLAMMFLSAILFNVVGWFGLTKGLTLVLQCLMVFIGAGLVVFDELLGMIYDQKKEYFVIQITSSMSLFITLLVAISSLI